VRSRILNIKRIIKTFRVAMSLVRHGPLVEDGWVKSFLNGQSIDCNSNPIPWLTYPAIDFLSLRLPRLELVFEYGSGNGTLWWATKAERVRAVENDAVWYERMRKIIPMNVDLYLEDLDTQSRYEEKILVQDCQYDVIVIDGRRRNKCMIQSLKRIKPNGVIVLDNSDRLEYMSGINELAVAGFKQIEFSGFCPIVNFKSQTSIFYRDNNILDI